MPIENYIEIFNKLKNEETQYCMSINNLEEKFIEEGWYFECKLAFDDRKVYVNEPQSMIHEFFDLDEFHKNFIFIDKRFYEIYKVLSYNGYDTELIHLESIVKTLNGRLEIE